MNTLMSLVISEVWKKKNIAEQDIPKITQFRLLYRYLKVFLKAILYYIFTVDGIIECDHIPSERP